MTDTIGLTLGFIFIAYLWGSLPTAVIVCHVMELADPRKQGSGNPGATNVLRIGNKRAAALTLIGDASKGFIALLPGNLLNLPPLLQALCCFAVILGHIYPILPSLKGGKGVATSLGACAALYWPLALAQLGIWCIMAFIGRISSLAAITAALLSPIMIAFLQPEHLPTICLISLLLLFSHRRNLQNLLQGREPRL